ncbi:MULTISPECIES: hypothetical protein [unclassified Nocardioides]|uniref:hypothetical protein n=1 Tax=unclassified Nocardioides TaxID=2615069 RepID=UPI0013FD1706|nr:MULTISPECIES: hypothetical protein [unclassified Nocardioides]
MPIDDGAADHLPGMLMPELCLSTSDGQTVDLAGLGLGRSLHRVSSPSPPEDLGPADL